MQYRKLGKSDLEVSTVIFGAWAIGGWWWGPQDDEESIKAIHAAIDAGITTIDTAPMYGAGHSEEVVGKAIKGRRDEVVIATKCGLVWDRTDGEFSFHSDELGGIDVYKCLKPESIKNECETSLKRLGVDVIDLYQPHWPDSTTPLEDTMSALLDLQQEGKIKTIGVCNFTPQMMATCLESGRIESDQPLYNLIQRDIEKEIVPFCIENQMGLIVFSPLAQGLLTGKVTMDREFKEGDNRASMRWFKPENRQKVLSALDQISDLPGKYNCSFAQLTIGWTIAQPGITSAIVGARNTEQSLENAKGADVIIEEADLQRIRSAFEAIS